MRIFKPALKFEITLEIDEPLNNKVVSSANSFDNKLIRKNGKSLINIINNKGPKTEP